MEFELKKAEPEDTVELARTLELGFEGYRRFQPEGWEPPAPELERIRARLANPAVWCLRARAAGEPAGHVSLMPAAIHLSDPDPDPGLAHLWQLFVREPWWGSGLAPMLLADAVAEARRRGYERFRLACAAGQSRARRFYEREGWSAVGSARLVQDVGLELIEYRRELLSP